MVDRVLRMGDQKLMVWHRFRRMTSHRDTVVKQGAGV